MAAACCPQNYLSSLGNTIIKMESHLVSVVIPTYNRADYLKQAVESVLAQTYTYFELLILDNCSNDHTPNIVSQFNDSRIKYIRHQCNILGTANWSYGIYWAKGEFVSILGDDDYYTSDFIESRINAFLKYQNIAAVFSNYDICNDQGAIISEFRSCYNHDKVLSGNELLQLAVSNHWFLGSTLYKRDLFVSLFEKSLLAGKAADTYLNINIALDKIHNRVAWICNKGLIYRKHDDQDTLSGGEIIFIGHVNACTMPFKFDDYAVQRSILQEGAIWAYASLSRNAWLTGRTKTAFRYTRWEISANPFRISPWRRLLKFSLLSLMKKRVVA